MRVVSSLRRGAIRLLSTFLFRSRLLLRIVEVIRAIGRGLLFGLFAEAFGFELPNLRPCLIEFRLQLGISFDGVSVSALPIAHFATEFGVLTSKFADFLPQLLDKSRQRLQLFVN